MNTITEQQSTEPRWTALAEHFQAARDTELGRWRWPEYPEYVVYPEADPDSVLVFDEATGANWKVDRALNQAGNYLHAAARAYWAAHPEPKPWHSAKPGEVWDIVTRRDDAGRAYVLTSGAFMLPHESFYYPKDIQSATLVLPLGLDSE